MRHRCLVLGLLAFSFAFANSASAIQSPDPQQPDSAAPGAYSFQLNARAVVLDVVVTNQKGEVVSNLGRDDFLIYEDTAPQTITFFDSQWLHVAPANPSINSTVEMDRREPNAPVTLIVLDEINTRFEDEAFARYSVKKFLDQQGEKLEHPTLLGAVDMYHFTLLHDYTTSKQELLSSLEHHLAAAPWHTEGSNWKFEQFKASFASLMEIAGATAGHPGHKSLLWIGRGFPPFDPATQSQQANDSLKQVIETCTNAMRDARITLYTLDPAGESTEAGDWNEDGFIDDPFNGQLDFNVMAKATGGHAFFGRNDVDRLIATSARDGASFYTLSYTPTVPVSDTKAFRSIRVVMKDPALHAETREGYFAHPAANSEMAAVGGGEAKRQDMDLALAAQSTLVYDAVHMTVKRISQAQDVFQISLKSSDLVWQEADGQKVRTKLTVVVETFDKTGAVVDRRVKISTLQAGEGATPNAPDVPVVTLPVSIPTKRPATRIRFLIRSNANEKLGTVNFPLDRESPASGESN